MTEKNENEKKLTVGGTYSINAVKIVSAVGGSGGCTAVGGGGSVSYPTNPSVYYPANPNGYNPYNPYSISGIYYGSTTTPNDDSIMMKLNKKILTSEDVTKLVEECIKIVKVDEKVIIMTDPGTTQEEMDKLALMMSANGLHGFVTCRPEAITVMEGQEPSNEYDRMDMLARLAVIWEKHPNLRLGQILAMTLAMRDDSKLSTLTDAELVALVEVSWV